MTNNLLCILMLLSVIIVNQAVTGLLWAGESGCHRVCCAAGVNQVVAGLAKPVNF